MKGDPQVLTFLNQALKQELTAINQYFLHAKMQENWGYNKLAAYTRKESIEEMVHAERITERILFLEGLPNYQRLLALRVGQTVREQFESDMAVELEVVERLRPAAAYCDEVGDRVTKNLFEEILRNEEEHIDYLETQLHLMDTIGEQLYLAGQIDHPTTGSN